MKKFLKLFSVTALTLVLVACNKKEEAPAETPEPQSSQVAESHGSSHGSAEVKQEKDEATQATDPNAESIKFVFHVSGEDKPMGEYQVKFTEGMSVLDAMKEIHDLDFDFNEDEGVIDRIGDHTNDYASGVTWAYLLNKQFAELGVVSQKLEAGDTIEWYYGTVDQIPTTIIPADDMRTPAPAEEPAEEEAPATE